ncbi:MAG: hypothetical protein GY939_10380 [Actinomycetia bacterium]|nr:hypothetical protein [Actinomycetes bacterium]
MPFSFRVEAGLPVLGNIQRRAQGAAMAGHFVLHTRWHTLDRLKEYQRTAKAWYNSPGDQAVLRIRLQPSQGVGRFVTG